MQTTLVRVLAACFFLTLGACSAGSSTNSSASLQQSDCDPGNGGLQLPDGFCAVVVADSAGPARHLTVADNGDIYVALRRLHEGGGIAALRDTNGDGRADVTEYFGPSAGSGIGIHDGHLYFASDSTVFRYPLTGSLIPSSPRHIVADELFRGRAHGAKPFTFDDAGWMYVNIGGPSNACVAQGAPPGSRAPDPCPLLEDSGGIWRFRADGTGQPSGELYAIGLKHTMALDWKSDGDRLYAIPHGRDQLNTGFPALYTETENANLPAEEFFAVDRGDAFGWPYCYYDGQQNKLVLAPEYGGDGQEVGRCAALEGPAVAFPAHWAPNDMVFYEATDFPAKYRGGAFIAFHGSSGRAPLPQEGFVVAFVPFRGAQPAGGWEVFADGFAGAESLESANEAQYRAMGVAVGPDGSLYIADSRMGKIWRVMYTG